MLVGEIGISRHEFLYDIRFWEVRRIIRGYRKRGKIFMHLLAENVFASTFAFRNPEGKKPRDMFPAIFEDDDDDDDIEAPLTEEERRGLQADMDAWNAQQQGESQP